MTVLYITQNGITDHIGRSQVAPYVIGLAKLGFSIHVLSAEKPGRDLLIQKYQALFDAVGVKWSRVTYRNQPKVFGQTFTQWVMQRAAQKIVRDESIRLVHCRSFPPAVIGYRLKRLFGVKFIFDFRDFYADGGLLKTRGLMRLAYFRMKQLEGPMIRNADKVVCLTDRARDVLSDWYLAKRQETAKRFQIIPCCADFEHFNKSRISFEDLAAARKSAGLHQNDFVLLYLGSLGPDYLLPQMLALFRQLLSLRPNARFLFVSNNGEDLVKAECAEQKIPLERIVFLSADREQVPSLIALANISVCFIRADITKAGCSPTKLAELLAMNVPVIGNSGVGDLDKILDLSRNGSTIAIDFNDESLYNALKKVICAKLDPNWIRDHSWDFDLSAGVARYAEVYSELLGG